MKRVFRRLTTLGRQMIDPPPVDDTPAFSPGEGGTDPAAPADENDRMAVAVISQERTASQSVYHSLRQALPEEVSVGHTHYVGETPWRQVWNPIIARKQMKELVVLRRLRSKARKRVVFTVWRDTLDRMVSQLWYEHANLLKDRQYPYAQDPKIQTSICVFLDKQLRYYPLVYHRIGARGVLKKGRNDLPSGVTLYALRFSNLENDFRAACLDAFGRDIPLLRINAAEQRQDADVSGYRNFAARFNLKDTLYYILRERYGIEKDMWANDFEPGVLGLSDKWISVLAAAVTKEALEN